MILRKQAFDPFDIRKFGLNNKYRIDFLFLNKWCEIACGQAHNTNHVLHDVTHVDAPITSISKCVNKMKLHEWQNMEQGSVVSVCVFLSLVHPKNNDFPGEYILKTALMFFIINKTHIRYGVYHWISAYVKMISFQFNSNKYFVVWFGSAFKRIKN